MGKTPASHRPAELILTLSCPDRRGIVHAIVHVIAAHGGHIIDSHQEVVRVDHAQGPAELAQLGRDAESVTLARAVRWHVEHRVLIHGRRTIVFSQRESPASGPGGALA